MTQRKYVLFEDFTEQKRVEENLWDYANFNPGGSYDNPCPEIMNDWNASKLTGSSKGLLIRSQAIKTTDVVNLRSMAVEVNVKGRLVGNSMFWIFTRVQDSIETR